MTEARRFRRRPRLGVTYDQSGNVVPDVVTGEAATDIADVTVTATPLSSLADWLKPPKLYAVLVLAYLAWLLWPDMREE